MSLNKRKPDRENLHDVLLNGRKLCFHERVEQFSAQLQQVAQKQPLLYLRQVISPADREVLVLEQSTKKPKKMLMFGSNNYLGLATHPYVKEMVQAAIKTYGVGVGGPPLLNGYSRLHRRVEERLSELKHSEDTLIFPTGYSTNVGLVTGLVNPYDCVIYDVLSHASFCDGLKMGHVRSFTFGHNDVTHFQQVITKQKACVRGDIFAGVEGVYSMDGDLAPLDKIVPICKKIMRFSF